MGHYDTNDLHRRQNADEAGHEVPGSTSQFTSRRPPPRRWPVMNAAADTLGVRRRNLAAPVCAIALLAACGTTGPDQPAPSPSGSVGSAVPVDAVADELFNELQAEYYFDMDQASWQQLRRTATSLPWRIVSAAGVEQAAACTGEGSPTVVYLDGFDTPAAQGWSLVAEKQADSNRVCLFDRPGMGLSPDRAGAAPHSSPELHAQEMFDMLQVVGERGPYVLVGWSYGGLVARSAAAQRPDRVAGMVLVDALSPLDPELDEPLNGENGIVDIDTVSTTVGTGPNMGSKPLIVLQAGQPLADTPLSAQKAWNDLQLQAATISKNSLHLVVNDSDYAIPLRSPGAVVAATSSVAESVREGNAQLPGCPEDGTDRATCTASP